MPYSFAFYATKVLKGLTINMFSPKKWLCIHTTHVVLGSEVKMLMQPNILIHLAQTLRKIGWCCSEINMLEKIFDNIALDLFNKAICGHQ